MLIKQHNFNDALADFRYVMKFAPGNAEALYGYGAAKNALGNTKEACETWKKAAALGSEQARIEITLHCRD